MDIEDGLGNTYQIKLLNKGGYVEIVKDREMNEYLDHYILAYKYPDKIRVFILDGGHEDEGNPNHINNFKVKSGKNFSWGKLNRVNIEHADFVYDISLLNIKDKIDKIAKGLEEILEKLYKNLSQFQYNVETILTGVDEKGNLLDPNDFSELENESNRNIETMRSELNSLVSIIKR